MNRSEPLRHVGDPVDRDETLLAVQRWHRNHGRLPVWAEWERATYEHPAAKTIHRRWGWYALLAEAIGIEVSEVQWEQGRSRNGALVRKRQRLLEDLIDWRRSHGRWPKYAEFGVGTADHATVTAYKGRFGSWARAIAEAGEMIG